MKCIAHRHTQLSTADLRFIMEGLFSINYYDLISRNYSLTNSEQELLESVVEEYRKGKPLEYILGESRFFGLRLFIDNSVFIPRPETEILVEEVLRYTCNKKDFYLLDIGTGSANIALALGLKQPSFRIFSVDISQKALKVARRNCLSLGLCNVFLINGDLLTCFKRRVFDVIVSNPPYVETSFIENEKGLGYEPKIALDGGPDGLVFIKEIFKQAKAHLKKDGLLFLEIGYNQKGSVLALADEAGFNLIELKKDYAGVERVAVFGN